MYFSKLDLNVEHGKVEIPYNPVLRIAFPKRTSQNQIGGVIVLNIQAKILLDELSHSIGNEDFWPVHDPFIKSLVDHDGYFLYHSVPKTTFGSMIPARSNHTFEHHYPGLNNYMCPHETRYIDQFEGYMIFSSIRPPRLLAKDYHSWTWALMIPKQVFTTLFWSIAKPTLTWGLAFWFFILLPASWQIGNLLTRRIIDAKLVTRNEKLFRVIFGSMYQFIGLLNSEGILTRINQAALDSSGLKEEDVIGKYFWDCYWWSLSQETKDDLKKAFFKARAGEFVRYVVKVKGLGDSIKTIDFSLKPVFGADGKVIQVIPEGRDISAQVEIEENLEKLVNEKTAKLMQNETRTSTFLENIADVIITADEDGFIEFVNSYVTKVFGYKPEEMIGKSVKILVPEPHYSLHDSYISNYISTGIKKIIGIGRELEALKKDGTKIPIFLSVSEFFLDGKRKFTGIIRDFTKLSEANKLIKQQAAFMLNNPAPVMRMTKTGEILEANPVAKNLFRFNLTNSINVKSIFPELSIDTLTFSNDGKITQIETSISEMTFLLSFSFDNNNNYLYLYASDITSRKQSEIELKKLAMVIKNTENAIIIADVNGIIEWVNDGFTKISGYKLHEAIGKTPGSLLQGPDTDPNTIALMGEAIKRKKHLRTEILNYSKDGSTHWQEVFIQPRFDEQGDLSGFIAVESDISDRKKIEFELANALVKAEEANQAKGNFLANMSHEIRTPMNAIIGMTFLAQQIAENDKLIKYLKQIDSSAHSLLSIINDILDVSKVEAGKLSIEAIEFSLTEVLLDLRNLVAIKAHQKGIEFLFDVAANMPDHLIGDPTRLRQILVNLVTNAIKFTQNGEVIVKITFEKDTSKTIVINFGIHDTGIGLTPESQKHLFTPFSQADSSTTRQYGGTGLGLTICKQLVHLMGGTIGLESTLGVGSLFYFQIPFEKASDKYYSPIAKIDETIKTNILYLEDNQFALEIISNMLKRMNFKVKAMSCALDMFNYLSNQSQPIDSILIIDSTFPNSTDCLLLDKLLTKLKKYKLPLVLLQTTTDYTFGHELLDTDYPVITITKPVTSSALFDALMRLLKGTSHFPYINSNRSQDKQTFNGQKILLVEDNEINREVAREILEQAGLQITEAFNGMQALETLKKDTFDLVLMDVQMPIMDGYEATRAIREQSKYKDLPILAMTANAMSGDRELAFKAGMNDHIPKPFKPKQLFGTLREWLKVDISNNFDNTNYSQDTRPNFPDISGISFQDGLNRMAGNANGYIKILQKFAKNASKNITSLTEAVNKNDRKTLSLLIHSIKGSAGNLGLIKLSEAAKEIEVKIVNSPEQQLPSFEDFTNTYLKQINLLEDWFSDLNKDIVVSSNENHDLKPLSEELTEQVLVLEKQLQKNDFNARKYWEAIYPFMSESIDPQTIKKIDELISDLEFNEARKIIITKVLKGKHDV